MNKMKDMEKKIYTGPYVLMPSVTIDDALAAVLSGSRYDNPANDSWKTNQTSTSDTKNIYFQDPITGNYLSKEPAPGNKAILSNVQTFFNLVHVDVKSFYITLDIPLIGIGHQKYPNTLYLSTKQKYTISANFTPCHFTADKSDAAIWSYEINN